MSRHVANQLPWKSTLYRKQRQIRATWNATWIGNLSLKSKG
ncbi:Hypothetical protein BSSP2_I0241 [Brucella suis bv. 2]|nr:hypothetical protein BCA52141_I1287 [Brucella canis HSK A52141]AEW16416.1 hypothetical protein BAA13334_I00059 [Brucella abortus A13334]AIB16976.1 Hypothetical protein BSSP3_I0241 [Brucella suis bv. 2]AIB20352.1 Hypothetical protein BSPT1_I0243 [Brucella suis bv. 2]AIB23723.1 Hypothetical protein BSPT2_I0244 [Brucella suis bv. 2]